MLLLQTKFIHKLSWKQFNKFKSILLTPVKTLLDIKHCYIKFCSSCFIMKPFDEMSRVERSTKISDVHHNSVEERMKIGDDLQLNLWKLMLSHEVVAYSTFIG